jgi:hypothetical protein
MNYKEYASALPPRQGIAVAMKAGVVVKALVLSSLKFPILGLNRFNRSGRLGANRERRTSSRLTGTVEHDWYRVPGPLGDNSRLRQSNAEAARHAVERCAIESFAHISVLQGV